MCRKAVRGTERWKRFRQQERPARIPLSLCFSLLLSASLCFLLLSPSPSCTVDMMGALSTNMRMYTYILTLSCTCNDRRAASNREAR